MCDLPAPTALRSLLSHFGGIESPPNHHATATTRLITHNHSLRVVSLAPHTRWLFQSCPRPHTPFHSISCCLAISVARLTLAVSPPHSLPLSRTVSQSCFLTHQPQPNEDPDTPQQLIQKKALYPPQQQIQKKALYSPQQLIQKTI